MHNEAWVKILFESMLKGKSLKHKSHSEEVKRCSDNSLSFPTRET